MASYSAHVDTFARDNLPPHEAWPEFVFDLPELQYPERLNAAGALLDDMAAGEAGSRPCVHTDDGVWSYQDLLKRANRVARVLVEDMGVVPGNRVLLRAANTPMLIAAWFGVLKAGGVVVATMPLLRATELATIIDKAQISHALTDARLTEELENARDKQAILSKVMTFGPGGELEARMEKVQPHFETVETAAEDVALIAFTSGTTGNPKGCMHSHRDVLTVCDTFARHLLDPQPDEVFTGTPPLAFTYGLGGLVLFPLRFGASTVPIEQPGPEALLRAIETYRVTTMFTAPTAYRGLLDMVGEVDLSSLRKCVSAGESLPRATSDAWFERTGIRIVDGIGATEMLHILSRPPETTSARARPVSRYRAIGLWLLVTTCSRSRPARSVGWRCAGRPGAATLMTRGRQTTS
jgi:2-aminobenzoate-CoA ligase